MLPAFPSSPGGFLGRAGVGVPHDRRSAGSLSASPALGALGGLSWLAFGSTAIAQKVVLAGAPVLAAILLYRAAVAAHRPARRRRCSRPPPTSLSG